MKYKRGLALMLLCLALLVAIVVVSAHATGTENSSAEENVPWRFIAIFLTSVIVSLFALLTAMVGYFVKQITKAQSSLFTTVDKLSEELNTLKTQHEMLHGNHPQKLM